MDGPSSGRARRRARARSVRIEEDHALRRRNRGPLGRPPAPGCRSAPARATALPRCRRVTIWRGAEILDAEHARRGSARRRRAAHARAARRARAAPAAHRCRRGTGTRVPHRLTASGPAPTRPSQHRKFIGGAADEAARRTCCAGSRRSLRAAGLLDHAVVHHDDLVAHRHRLELVVGDIDRGGAHPVVQRAQLLAHQLAELGVERAQRLVHQEGLRVGARWRGRAPRAGGRRRRARRPGGRGGGRCEDARDLLDRRRISARGMP